MLLQHVRLLFINLPLSGAAVSFKIKINQIMFLYLQLGTAF